MSKIIHVPQPEPEDSSLQVENYRIVDAEVIHTEKESSFKEKMLGYIALTLTLGVIGLALIDPSCRPGFLAFANTAIAGYIGVQVGKNQH